MRRCRTLARALDIERGEIVAFVGGGGKTAAILRLTTELRGGGWRVLATTTTKVGPSIGSFLEVVEATGHDWRGGVAAALERRGAAFLAGGHSPGGKLTGIAPAAVDPRLAALADAVLIEADGSRQAPIKAPAPHEPVVPPSTTLVVPMVGIDALGRPIEAPDVHRPRLLRALTGADTVTPEAVVRLLTSEAGSLKGVPPGARISPILNKVRPDSRKVAAGIARAVLAAAPAALDRVIVADVAASQFARLAGPRG